MKIVDNRKDFYDYVVGEYGIDDLIVFDRRKAVIIKTDVKPEKYADYLFSSIKGDKDDYQKETTRYFPKKVKVKEGTIYRFALKTGRRFYHFEIERYLTDDENVCVETRLVEEEDNDVLYPDLILAILPYQHSRSYFFFEDRFRPHFMKNEIINLPILKNTAIPRYVSAQDVFLNIYSYLSSKKEVKIEDNRSDILKLESAGFDKVESFRNIK